MKSRKSAITKSPLISLEHKRDAYGFAVRPQHVQRYREYATIYKEEEEERSDRWKSFLERQAESAQLPVNEKPAADEENISKADAIEEECDVNSHNVLTGDKVSTEKPGLDNAIGNVVEEKSMPAVKETKSHKIQTWADIRSSLCEIEDLMSTRVKKKGKLTKYEQENGSGKLFRSVEEARTPKAESDEDSEDEFYDVERSDPIQDSPSNDTNASVTGVVANMAPAESSWKEELEVLVRGGVPMALRGELWQAFVGVKARRVKNYYWDLLAPENTCSENVEQDGVQSNSDIKTSTINSVLVLEKWKGQIEKDLPRTFPGHPALDENGRNALRRLLTAYARHNPSVGYCQAMNFFAGLLLLMMPEENAFWTLMGILDDYFDGYYSEEMVESQVDQLVLDELVHERFPKLVNHLDYLGVQVAWVTGPWFLSIFMNMLPWESVLRVWDVLLFEGNRVMLFRTALALMELYGPALVTTKDAGDAVTLLQSLASSTFDSSQLVLTACMGFQNVTETRLQELRDKHRPAVIAALEERAKGLRAWKDSKGLASKLYSFKHDPKSAVMDLNKEDNLNGVNGNLSRSESGSTNADEVISGLTGDEEIPDLQEQVVLLKVELCKVLEERRSAELRADELETALMEMVKQDNRRQLSARVEQLEQEVNELRQALADKQEQEQAMLQVLMRVEQEQKLTEDARRFAEQDAEAQRYAAQVLQDKYEEAVASLAEMEKRAVLAESMLEATLQYQSGQAKAQPSPRSPRLDSSSLRNSQEMAPENPARKTSLLSRPFGLGWRDKNKGKPTTSDDLVDSKSTSEERDPGIQQEKTSNTEQEEFVSTQHKDSNGH